MARPSGPRAAGFFWPGLDGLRGVAVLAVLAFHAGVSWLPGGLLGVDVFFVLSGFLITTLLLDERRRTGRISLASFWFRRARRLLPALLLVLVTTTVAWRLVQPATFATLRSDVTATLLYVANWHFAANGSDYFVRSAQSSPLLHTWSLSVEEQFYVLWPLVVLVVGWIAARRAQRRRLFAVAVFGALASTGLMAALFERLPAGASTSRLYYGTDAHCAALLVGAALAAALAGRLRPLTPTPVGKRWTAVLGGVAAVALGSAFARFTGESPLLYQGGFLLVALLTAVLVLVCVRQPSNPVARALGVAPLRALGRISYGLYLWHWPVMLLLDHGRTGLTGMPLLLARFATSIALAAGSWLLVERPVLAWQPRRLTVRRAVLPAAASTVFAAALAVQLVPLPRLAQQADLESLPAAVELPSLSPLPGRPTLLLVGDSVALTLGEGWGDPTLGANVVTKAGIGCSILGEATVSPGAGSLRLPASCGDWRRTYPQLLATVHPQIVAVLGGRWELADYATDSGWEHIGQPAFDQRLTQALDDTVTLLHADGAPVALLTAPCFRSPELPDGDPNVMDDPARLARWNQLLRDTAARHPDYVRVFDLGALLCPNGTFRATRNGTALRWADGIHITKDGGHLVGSQLLPQIVDWANAVARGRGVTIGPTGG